MQHNARFLSRLCIACWFMGMVAFAVWGSSVQGEGAQQQYLPLMVRYQPLVTNPAAHQYVGTVGIGYGNASDIYTVRADGSELTRLTNDAFFDTQPQWSHDGSMIAFLHATQPFNTYGASSYRGMVMNRDGSDLRPLVSESSGDTIEFAWSPLRNELVVASKQNDDDLSYKLEYVAPLAGTSTIITNAGGGWQWSPNGAYIFYSEDRGGFWVHSIADHSDTLIADARRVHNTTWSPTSDALVVQVSHPHYNDITVLVIIDGQQNQTLFQYPYKFVGWFADGIHLLVEDRLTHQLYVQARTSSDLTLFEGGGRSITLSPHDNTVFYQADRFYIHRLGYPLSLAIDDTICRLITDFPQVSSVTWALDGKSLVYTVVDTTERTDVYKTCYLDLTATDLVSQPVTPNFINAAQLTYLPYSSNLVVGQQPLPYPPPRSLSPHLIHAENPPSAIPIVPDSFAVGYDWIYLPKGAAQR